MFVELSVQRDRLVTRNAYLMRFGPEHSRNGQWIDAFGLPPSTLMAMPVEFTVVQPADRDGEAVADFAAHHSLLGELDVVGIGGDAAADKARLGSDKPQMVAIALTHRFADDSNFV
jgi:hypothetical protein